MNPSDSIVAAIREANGAGRPALVAFLTAGFPGKEDFPVQLEAIGGAADVVEIGVPFSDPMADGMTIQRSSRVALGQGVSLSWIIETLRAMPRRPRAPLLLMSYLNPLLAYGLDRLPADARAAGVSGFIVPDLPFEESAELRTALEAEGLALVQMVTPVTPPERLATLCEAARGFVYAVTMTGTTGKQVDVPPDVLGYMDRVRAASPAPVCAGFGIRTREQVARMTGHVDGVVVGSALVEVLERGEDPAAFLRALRGD
ncbi:MAG: tryptophan synthase subunit alpha [Steroidobacteraceae bacterium]|jgi:tryptophan synthase alpha chain|nr:tryptophan synthase subunit alpha [Steroidobacteraceae bacterium]